MSGTGDRKGGTVTDNDSTPRERRRRHGVEHTGIRGEVRGGSGVHHPLLGGCLQSHSLKLVQQRSLIPRGRGGCRRCRGTVSISGCVPIGVRSRGDAVRVLGVERLGRRRMARRVAGGRGVGGLVAAEHATLAPVGPHLDGAVPGVLRGRPGRRGGGGRRSGGRGWRRGGGGGLWGVFIRALLLFFSPSPWRGARGGGGTPV